MADWGWSEELAGRDWGSHYYFELYPRLVAELAPGVPYTPGSPFSPAHSPVAETAEPDHGPNDPRWGTVHLWSQWNELPATSYRDVRPHFVAEFGWQGPPTWATLTRAIHDEPLTPDSPAMLTHQKADSGHQAGPRPGRRHRHP